MTTHWVCGEFDAESCGGVKTVVLSGIRGQNRLSIFCSLVHVLPTASRFCKIFQFQIRFKDAKYDVIRIWIFRIFYFRIEKK